MITCCKQFHLANKSHKQQLTKVAEMSSGGRTRQFTVFVVRWWRSCVVAVIAVLNVLLVGHPLPSSCESFFNVYS